MTTKDKFVTAIMLILLVWGDQVVRLWWGWVCGGVFILRCLNADLQIVVPSIW